MPVQGTWGIGKAKLPDFGFTELLRELSGRAPSAERQTTFNNPLVYQNKGISTAPVQNRSYATNTPNASYADQGNVLGASTGGGGYGGGYGGGTSPQDFADGGGGGVDELALAEMARRNRINSYKAQASNLRNEGQGTFDNILAAIGKFRDRSKTLFSNAGQEITNRASDILGSNARTGNELEGETRARGRAMGLGDSSKFLNQGKLSAQLAATQGNTIARRGEEDRANSAQFQGRQDEAQGQENEANTYLKSVRDRAAGIENLGYDAGEEQYANSLNDIVNYQRQLAQINPVNAAGLTQYAPNFSGITNTLNGILGGGGQTAEAQDAGNPTNPTDIFALLKRRGLVA